MKIDFVTVKYTFNINNPESQIWLLQKNAMENISNRISRFYILGTDELFKNILDTYYEHLQRSLQLDSEINFVIWFWNIILETKFYIVNNFPSLIRWMITSSKKTKSLILYI